MNVPELRKAIQECDTPATTINGRPVWKLPNGTLVSKARKAELEAYYTKLTKASVRKPRKTAKQAEYLEIDPSGELKATERPEQKIAVAANNLADCMRKAARGFNAYGDLLEVHRKIAVCDRKIRKYQKRKQSPGNVRSREKWQMRLARLLSQS